MAHATWLADYRWAMNAMRARRWRRKLGFAARVEFDTALRPRLPNEPGKVIAYPDAFYHFTVDDFCRAIEASVKMGTYVIHQDSTIKIEGPLTFTEHA